MNTNQVEQFRIDKRKLHLSSTVVIALLAAMTFPATTQAATEAQKQTAISNGLEWLAQTQQSNGSWNNSGYYNDAVTGAALLSFLEKGYQPGDDVVINGNHYGNVVGNALNYILNNALTVDLSNDTSPPAGYSSDYFNGRTGVYWDTLGQGEPIYTTGLVLSALSKVPDVNAVVTTGPLTGSTYKDVIQQTVDYFAWGQNGPNAYYNGRGGWRYFANEYYDGSDNSTSQWPVIGLLFAQQAGVATPEFVKDELRHWISYIQNPNGGSGYSDPYYLVNEAKTGGLLLEMALTGTDVNGNPFNANISGNPEHQALDYLNTHWQNLANGWDGNFGQPYAMWGVYKGLQSTIGLNNNTHITNLGSCGQLSLGVQCNWYQNYNESLVNTQNGNGSWDAYSYWGSALTTAWNISILSATEVIPEPGGEETPAVPEPNNNIALIGLGLLGLGATLRKRCS